MNKQTSGVYGELKYFSIITNGLGKKGHDKNITYSLTMHYVCLYTVPFLQVRKSDVGRGVPTWLQSLVHQTWSQCQHFPLFAEGCIWPSEPSLPTWTTAQKGLFSAPETALSPHPGGLGESTSQLPPSEWGRVDGSHPVAAPLVSCFHALHQLTSPLSYWCFLRWQPN